MRFYVSLICVNYKKKKKKKREGDIFPYIMCYILFIATLQNLPAFLALGRSSSKIGKYVAHICTHLIYESSICTFVFHYRRLKDMMKMVDIIFIIFILCMRSVEFNLIFLILKITQYYSFQKKKKIQFYSNGVSFSKTWAFMFFSPFLNTALC